MTGHFAPSPKASRADALPMPAAYARLVLRQFGADPERAARIVLGTGIDPADRDLAAPANEITLKQLFRLVENVSAVEPAGWGLSIGRNLGVAAHGPLGLAMASATTLAEALAVLEQYAHVRGPYFRLVSEETTEAYRLRVEPQMRMDRAIWRPLIETPPEGPGEPRRGLLVSSLDIGGVENPA